jgi:hypothetical protein
MNSSCLCKHTQIFTIGFLIIALASCGETPVTTELVATKQEIENNTTAYPAPVTTNSLIPQAWPTLSGGTPNPYYSYFATPAPEESVAVVNLSEIAPPSLVAPRYEIVGENLSMTSTALYVVDTQNKSRVRLGDDTGTAIYGEISEKYFAWFFLCQSQCAAFASGLYWR